MTGEENLRPPSLPTPFFLLNGFGVFLEGEPDNLTCQIEYGATGTAFFRSPVCIPWIIVCSRNWWLNDYPHMSNLLIFVGTIKVECMLNPCESRDRTEDNTNNHFRIGEKPSFNVVKYPSGLEEKVQDFETTVVFNKDILKTPGVAESSIYNLTW